MRTIRESMTAKPVCVSPDTTLQAAARLMGEKDFGFLPVMAPDGRVKGVLTDRDIVVRAIAKGLNPAQSAVSECMSTDLEFVPPETSVDEAVHLMETRKIRRLLVCEEKQLVGVVSLGDLAECEPEAAEAVLVEVSKSPQTLAHG